MHQSSTFIMIKEVIGFSFQSHTTPK